MSEHQSLWRRLGGLATQPRLPSQHGQPAPHTFIEPMLAKLVEKLPEGTQWEYELKLDGYRLEAIKTGDKARLYSRRGNDFTRKFARIAASVVKLKADSVVLDGEAVVTDPQGRPSFQMLQNRAHLPAGWSLVYYAFDLLHLDGRDLQSRPLSERRKLLEGVLGNSGVLLSRSLPGTLPEIIAAVKQHELEGMPLKPKQDFVIGGFRLEGKRLELLLVGYYWEADCQKTLNAIRFVGPKPARQRLIAEN